MISHLLSPKSSSTPKRLNKVSDKSDFEEYCQKICPYIIVLFSVILIALALIIVVKYGRLWFSTPQNISEHMNEVVLYYGGLNGFL